MRIIHFFLPVVLLTIACTEDPLSVGTEIVGSDSHLQSIVFDNMETHTIERQYVDAINSNKGMLGNLHEHNSGNRKAELLVEFIKSYDAIDYDSITIDSVVLYLAYEDQTGHTAVAPDIHIVLDSLPSQARTDFDTDQLTYEPINAAVREIRNNESLKQLSFPLDVTSLLPYITVAENKSLSLYLQYADAIGIDEGALHTLLYFSTESYLAVYCKNSEAQSDTLRYRITQDSKRIGLFINDYSTSAMATIINDTLTTHSIGYIQGMAGPRLHLKIPQEVIDTIKNINPINKARLLIPLHASSDANPVPFLRAKHVLADGREVHIKDSPVFTSETHARGHFENGRYELNITLHVNEILKDHASNTLIFDPAINISNTYYYDFLSPNTSVIDGENIKLEIIYSKID